MVRVDPDNRCAVMVAYGKKLVVLPFRRDSSLDEIELHDVKPMKKTPVQLIAKTPILASYIITLKDLDEKIDNVRFSVTRIWIRGGTNICLFPVD